MTALELFNLLLDCDRLNDSEFRDTEYVGQRIDIHLENADIVATEEELEQLAKEVQTIYGL
jgi:hypothetical protein